MRHPLEGISPALRKPFFYFFLLLTLSIFGVFRYLDVPLQTAAAPNGIVSYELAGSLEVSQSILRSWDAEARLFAAFGLGFDYLFMPVYAVALSLGLLLAGYEKLGVYHTLTAWAGWGVFLAALFDAVENYALWQSLIGDSSPLFPQLAAFCATVKFVLLLVGMAIALIGMGIKKKVDG